MEWGRVKSVLIGVFLIVNIFLLATYVRSFQNEVVVTAEMLHDMQVILQKNGVLVEADLVPGKIGTVPLFDSSNRYVSTAAMAQQVIGEGVQSTEQSFVCTQFPPQKHIVRLNERTAKKAAKAMARQMGLIDGILVEAKTVQEGDGYRVQLFPVHENHFILDVWLTFWVTKDGVVRLQGENWLMEEMVPSGLTMVKSPVEILVDFASLRQKEAPCVITDLQLGYFLGSRKGQRMTVTAAPVWSITTSDGKCFFYDARNGDFLAQ